MHYCTSMNLSELFLQTFMIFKVVFFWYTGSCFTTHNVIICLVQSIWQRQYYIQLPKKSLFKHQNQLFKLTLIKYKLHHIIVKANFTFFSLYFPKNVWVLWTAKPLSANYFSNKVKCIFFATKLQHLANLSISKAFYLICKTY